MPRQQWKGTMTILLGMIWQKGEFMDGRYKEDDKRVKNLSRRMWSAEITNSFIANNKKVENKSWKTWKSGKCMLYYR